MFSVDRILRQQRDARLAAESARLAKQEESRQSSDLQTPTGLKESHMDNNQSPIISTEGKSKAPLPFSNPFQNLRRKIGSMATSQQTTGPVKEMLSSSTSVDPVGQPEIKGDMSGIAGSGGLATSEARADPTPTRSPDSGGLGVTPWSNICMTFSIQFLSLH
jgi:hypothetical protein